MGPKMLSKNGQHLPLFLSKKQKVRKSDCRDTQKKKKNKDRLDLFSEGAAFPCFYTRSELNDIQKGSKNRDQMDPCFKGGISP